jgi:hypothetical protein
LSILRSDLILIYIMCVCLCTWEWEEKGPVFVSTTVAKVQSNYSICHHLELFWSLPVDHEEAFQKDSDRLNQGPSFDSSILDWEYLIKNKRRRRRRRRRRK